ncbi:hypothetical protein [Devriesea agamarum]|uniref:hypothetical protein n=1 Tax=Devriesea agamarum TaxID=472569 RepID=UPI00071D86CC|nr:hypothetical protein [Devriesea agamarum]
MMAFILIDGAIAGLGLTLLIYAAIPASPQLRAALSHLDGHSASQAPGLTGDKLPIEYRLGQQIERLVTSLPGIVTPTRDLALLGLTSTAFYGRKALLSFLGFLLPIVLGAFAFILGLAPPPFLTVGLMVILGIVFFLLPDLAVRKQAARARHRCSRILAAYIDFIALAKIGGAGSTQAMIDASLVGDNELFLRIRQIIERARLRGTNAWDDLRELGAEFGLKELDEIADIVRLSGEEGVSIWESLRARAHAVRIGHLRDDQAQANAQSEGLSLPVALLAAAFIGLLIAPALLKLAVPS